MKSIIEIIVFIILLSGFVVLINDSLDGLVPLYDFIQYILIVCIFYLTFHTAVWS